MFIYFLFCTFSKSKFLKVWRAFISGPHYSDTTNRIKCNKISSDFSYLKKKKKIMLFKATIKPAVHCFLIKILFETPPKK